jgi:hypothetical protein
LLGVSTDLVDVSALGEWSYFFERGQCTALLNRTGDAKKNQAGLFRGTLLGFKDFVLKSGMIR